MSESLQARLRSAHKVIRDATREALRAAEREETLPGVTVGGGEGNDRYDNLDTENNYPNAFGSRSEKDAERKAFEMGMSLFGEDTGAIERDVAERLGRVEAELQDIVARAERSSASARQDRPAAAATASVSNEDLGGIDEEDEEREARFLAAKSAFLRRCGAARAALDDEEALALSEAPPGPTSAGGEGGRSTLVEAARLLSEAERVMKEANYGIAAAAGGGEQKPADIDAAGRIVESLCARTRRRRVDLQVRAAAVLDACIAITPDIISIGSGAGGKRSGDGLADAYEALQLLSQSDDAQASSSDRLEDAMIVISDDIYRLVLKPILITYRDSISKGKSPPTVDFQSSTTGAVDSANATRIGVGGVFLLTAGPTHKLKWKSHSHSDSAINKASSVEGEERSLSAKQTIACFGHVLVSVKIVLAFVHEHVLLERPELCRTVGRALFGEVVQEQDEDVVASDELGGNPISLTDERFGRLMNEIVNVAWNTCLPPVATEEILSELHALGQEMRYFANDFEKHMAERGFLDLPLLAGGTSKQSPLGLFATNFERRYAEKCRTSILAEGRHMLTKGDYHSIIEIGEDVYAGRARSNDSPLDFDENDDGMEVFEFHKCAISRVASELMHLVRNTMETAVNPQCFKQGKDDHALTHLPPILYQTSRELFDLFRAVIPSTHGNEVSTVPRTAAVLHNDCVFFAHQLLTFGLEYRDRFPDDKDGIYGGNAAALRKLCTFVDLVPPFRELADRTMIDTIERHKRQLVDVVGSRISILRDALRSDEGVVEWTDAETALAAGAYHLRHLSNSWAPILSRDVYGRAVGNLVDTLFSLYLHQIMVARDISEAASHFVGALFRDAERKLADLFSSEASSLDEAMKIAQKFCLLWNKFEAVGKFMDMSLLDISNALSAGVFRSVTGPELTKLIKAAFDDNDRRRDLLKVLSSDS